VSNPEVESWAGVARALSTSLQIRHIYVGPRANRKRFGLPSIRATIAGKSVVGEVSGEGDPPATFANLSVRVPGSSKLTMRIYRSFVYPQIGRVIGSEDVIVGDPHFDRSFIVKSSDPHDARLWLSQEVRSFIAQAPDFCFDVDCERATATSHRCDDAIQIESAMRALAAIACGSQRLDENWKRLARRLGAPRETRTSPWLSGDAPTMTFTSGGRQIALDIGYRSIGRRGKSRLLTRLRCRRVTTRRDRFVFFSDRLGRKDRPHLAARLARCDLQGTHPSGFVVHSGNSDRLKQRLQGRWIRAVESVQPLALVCAEDFVELWWAGAIFDEQKVRNAAELCEHFAHETDPITPSGPYR
jgi:hypothetical protein